jgi:hypothetical protein
MRSSRSARRMLQAGAAVRSYVTGHEAEGYTGGPEVVLAETPAEVGP